MANKDISEKHLEAWNDVFADIVNVLLFDGRRLICEDELESDTKDSMFKPNGIFYCSFKFGDFEGMRNGRYFSDFSETELCSLIGKSASLEKIKLWKTKDSRPERSEIWLNSLWRNRPAEHLPDL